MKHLVSAVLVMSFAAAASAGEFRFDYSPESLSTPEGVDRLHARLETAVNAYCRAQYITLNVHEAQKCSRSLMEQTVKQIGNARLAALQEDREQRSS